VPPERKRLTVLAEQLLLFLLALSVRLAYQEDSAARVGLDATRIPEYDQNTFHVWAERIAGGDVLSRDMVHPHHAWARIIATEAEWESWTGTETFHQAPLYPYLAGLVYAAVGPRPRAVATLQAVIGSLTALLAWRLGRRLHSPLAGRVAGIAVALSGPLVFLEGELLRETVMAFLLLAFVDVAETARERGTARAYLALGSVLALSILAKPTALLLLPVPFLVPLLGPPGRSGRAAAAAAIGLLAGFAPVVARNLAVGAAPLSIETRGPEAFVAGNAEGSTGVHWFPPETQEKVLHGHARRILRATEFRFLPTVVATLKTHAGDPAGYLKLLGKKLAAVLKDYEPPNNERFDHMRVAVPLLRVPFVTFGLVVPFAIPGIVVALRGWRRNLPLLAAASTGLLVPVAFYVIARFRAPAIPALSVLAGIDAAVLVALARESLGRGGRPRSRILLASNAALSVALLVFAFDRPAGALARDEAFVSFDLARQFQSAGDLEKADLFLDRAVALAPENLALAAEALYRRGGNALARGDAAGAKEAYGRFLDLEKDPRVSRLKPSMKIRSRLGLGRAALLSGDAGAAAREFEAAARDAIAASPPEVDLLRECAEMVERSGDASLALEAARALLRINPNDADADARVRRLTGG